MAQSTKGWFGIGMALIIATGAIYGLAMLLGVSFAVGAATQEAGAPVLLVLAVPGMGALGFLILLLKVVVDRVGNAEDDHYSKTVDQ